MRTILPIALLVLTTATPATGQTGGHIGLYSDAYSYADCNLVAPPFALLSVYVVHQQTDANGSQFRLIDYGTDLTKTGYVSNHAVNIGDDPFVETQITYDGTCPHVVPILIGTIGYFHSGEAVACSTIWVTGAPSTGKVLGTGCDGVTREATRGYITVNVNETCPCGFYYWDPTPTEESTWGTIKAQYR